MQHRLTHALTFRDVKFNVEKAVRIFSARGKKQSSFFQHEDLEQELEVENHAQLESQLVADAAEAVVQTALEAPIHLVRWRSAAKEQGSASWIGGTNILDTRRSNCRPVPLTSERVFQPKECGHILHDNVVKLFLNR